MKKQPLQIPITIYTGHFESGDIRKDDRIRLDQTSYYLSSIFWSLDLAAKSYDLLEGESEIRLFTFPEFRGHVQSLCELGNALAERLTVYSLAIKDTEQSEVKKMFDLERTEKDIMNLFGLITAIKSSAENVSGQIDGDTELLDKHTESVAQLCDIANEKLSSVWKDVSDIETSDESENKTLSPAEMLSLLIRDETLPLNLSDAITDAVVDLINKHRSEREFSPEFIAELLEEARER